MSTRKESIMREEASSTAIGWNFDNSYACLPQILFSLCNPVPVAEPRLIIFNHVLAKELGLKSELLESDEGIATFAGNYIPEGATPLAQAYAGHQFGYFTKLGDGRAILLGEQITPSGKRMDIQLKGSGRTPYSRRGDGRAALGPMLREYIISEAMHALGVETTRSLAVVTTGEAVMRYTEEQGAILTRVADSHLRVGTFQYVARWGTEEDLRALADYALNRHFPDGKNTENKYLYLLQEVIRRQAKTIAQWQQIGFIHGVMNTDNMTISGETIDYGPCAFMDTYDPATVFSSIDRDGRYAYGNQPPIAAWNLARFAETLLPLLDNDHEQAIKIAQTEIERFSALYQSYWVSGMREKLGIFNEESKDIVLIQDLLNILKIYKADYTNTFLDLTNGELTDKEVYKGPEFLKWYQLWQERLQAQEQTKEEAYELMKRRNPVVIPRNHRVEEALKAATEFGDYSVMEQLLEVLSCPYVHSDKHMAYTTLPELSDQP